MQMNAIVVRYAEVFLKGGRRSFFVTRLREALERQLRPIGGLKVREVHGMLLVVHRDATGNQMPDIVVGPEVHAAIGRTFGVVNYAPARVMDREITGLESWTERFADEFVAGAGSFRVEARRADKDFPINSIELNRRLGSIVYERTHVPVRLHGADRILYCLIQTTFAALYGNTLPGPGGLPVSTAGQVMLLLSGGIDSPVAGYLAMRRGCDLDAVHFHAEPYTLPAARRKVEALAAMLATHERRMRLFMVPFAAVQADLRDHAPGRMLVVLYRRMMMRIANQLAVEHGSLALVTGENLGQVASQTLENLAVVEAASVLPVLRPLLTYDKQETITLAQRIGTFETSRQPGDDCCTLFVPPHPETAARAQVVERIEAKLDIAGMVASALAGTRMVVLGEPEADATSRSSPASSP